MSTFVGKAKNQIPPGLTARMALAYNAGYRVQVGPGPEFLSRTDLQKKNGDLIKAAAIAGSSN